MKSNMSHSFSNVPRASIQRSSFQRNFSHKTVIDADYLVPILVDDVIPGDAYNVQCNFVAKLTSPTLVPLLDNLSLDTFFFFVPYRLLWDNWEKFCGAQVDPGDSIDFTIPVCAGVGVNSIGDCGDYMGLPVGHDMDALDVSALPFRALKLIWNEWFRDQNLQDSLTVDTDNGPDSSSSTGNLAGQPPKRGKRADYFTSALPWPQKGTAVSLPLSGTAEVITGAAHTTTGMVGMLFRDEAGSIPGTGSIGLDGVGEAREIGTGSVTGTGISPTNLYASLPTSTSTTINDIRLAFQTQKLLERDARSGTRYVETLLAHWGVTVPDFRLQRPEFLGGGSSRVNMSAVAQTTYQGTQTIEDAKGAMSGIGQAAGTHSFNKSFVEHGVIIGLANIKSDITYSQGIDRYWHKSTRYDFYYPVLAQIGEQSILNKELWFNDDANDELVFGYQERYAEYRYKNSMLTSLMRVDATDTLSVFHLSEDFGSLPTLGDTFITANTAAPLDRALSIPTQPGFVADFFFEMRCARPMPMYGVPGNLDRF